MPVIFSHPSKTGIWSEVLKLLLKGWERWMLKEWERITLGQRGSDPRAGLAWGCWSLCFSSSARPNCKTQCGAGSPWALKVNLRGILYLRWSQDTQFLCVTLKIFYLLSDTLYVLLVDLTSVVFLLRTVSSKFKSLNLLIIDLCSLDAYKHSQSCINLKLFSPGSSYYRRKDVDFFFFSCLFIR